MADRVEVFDVTVPAGTAKASPQTTALSFLDGEVTEVEVVIPPGPHGLVGFQLAYGGGQLIPRTAGAFIVADDEVIRWPVESYPTGGRWSLIAYNTGVYAHTLEVRFLVNELQTRAGAPAQVTPVQILPDVIAPGETSLGDVTLAPEEANA